MALRRRLATDDFARDHAAFTAAGIEWVRLGARQRPALPTRLRPADYDYGRVAVWKDLYDNLWDLVRFAPGHPAASPPQ